MLILISQSTTGILQNKAIRAISKTKRLDHCKPIFIKFEMLTVIKLYIFLCSDVYFE